MAKDRTTKEKRHYIDRGTENPSLTALWESISTSIVTFREVHRSKNGVWVPVERWKDFKDILDKVESAEK
jgi:hypothetical protein